MSLSNFKKSLDPRNAFRNSSGGVTAKSVLAGGAIAGLDPAGSTIRQVTGRSAGTVGGFLDPAGLVDKPNSPAETVLPPPAINPADEQSALNARDKIRRLAYRAKGRQSTIKVGALADQYSGQQKQLLGS